MKKKSFYLVILCFFALTTAILITGCQKSENKSDPQYQQMKQLAKNEKQWLNETEPLAEKTKSLYSKWGNKEITWDELNQQYTDIHNNLKVIKSKYEKYMKENPLSKETENSPDYKDGLLYGKTMRSDLNNFLYTVTNGYITKSTKQVTKLNEQQLKILYQDRIEKNYNEHLQKLQISLKKYE